MEDIKQIAETLKTSVEKGFEKIDAEKASKQDMADINKKLNTMQAILHAQGQDAMAETKQYKAQLSKAQSAAFTKEFADAMDKASLWSKCDNSDKHSADAVRKHYIAKTNANANEIDSTAGVGMLPTIVDSVIQKLIPLYGTARNSCRVVSGVKGFFQINSQNAYPVAHFTASGSTNRDDGTVTPNSGTFTKVNVQPLQASAISLVTEKLIWDATPGVLENEANNLAIAHGTLEDTTLFTGDPDATTGAFAGLKTASIGYNNINVNTRTGGFTNFDPLLAMRQNVYPSVSKSPDCKYWMHPFTFALLQTFKAATAGLYFFDPSISSFKIGGSEVEFNQFIDSPDADQTTFAISKVPVYYGDMKKAVTMVLGRDSQLKILYELYAAANEIGLRYTQDFNFGIQLGAALTRISIVS